MSKKETRRILSTLLALVALLLLQFAARDTDGNPRYDPRDDALRTPLFPASMSVQARIRGSGGRSPGCRARRGITHRHPQPAHARRHLGHGHGGRAAARNHRAAQHHDRRARTLQHRRDDRGRHQVARRPGDRGGGRQALRALGHRQEAQGQRPAVSLVDGRPARSRRSGIRTRGGAARRKGRRHPRHLRHPEIQSREFRRRRARWRRCAGPCGARRAS